MQIAETELGQKEMYKQSGFRQTRLSSFVNNNNSALLPGYTRMDATVNYQWSNSSSIQLRMENLTDELYFPSSHSTHQITVAPPFNVRVAFTASF